MKMFSKLSIVVIMSSTVFLLHASPDAAPADDAQPQQEQPIQEAAPSESPPPPPPMDEQPTAQPAPAPEQPAPAATPEMPAGIRRPEPKKIEEPAQYGPGVDTIDIESGGNWLQKRVIWEEAQAKHEKIKNIQQVVFDARMDFFIKRSSSDKELNLFYADIGFAQGELDEILDTLLESIEKERKQQGALTEQERELQAKLIEKKNELEQLKTDVKSIADLDAAMDNALTQLLRQINLADTYEKEAWQKFKAIGQELDDKKAKDDYRHIETAAKNIEAIAQYIRGSFTQYFNMVLGKVQEYMQSVKSRLETLKQSGVELKKKLTDLEETERAAHENEQMKPAKPKSKGFIATVTDAVMYPFSLVYSWVSGIPSWIGSWFVGKPKSVKPPAPPEPAT